MTRTRLASTAAALLAAFTFVRPAAGIRRARNRSRIGTPSPRRRTRPPRDAAAAAIPHVRDPPRGHPRRAERHRPPLRALHARPRRGAWRVGRRRRRQCRARSAGDADPRAGRARRRRLRRVFLGVPEGPAKAAGIAVGQRRRAGDAEPPRQGRRRHRSAARLVPKGTAGDYQFTAPFDLALLPGWGRLQPFAIALADHRLDGPLPVTSRQYARDLTYLQSIGALDSTTRTAEQSTIAQFWYEDSPLGWNRIANSVVRQRRLDRRPRRGRSRW